MKEDIDGAYLEEGDVYSQEKRQRLLEDDEISPEEEAFMEGWEEGWKNFIVKNFIAKKIHQDV